MSEVTELSAPIAAGNTTETLLYSHSLPYTALTQPTENLTPGEESEIEEGEFTEDPPDDPFDDENTFDVSRAEFTELQDALLRVTKAIDKYNIGASHKIAL